MASSAELDYFINEIRTAGTSDDIDAALGLASDQLIPKELRRLRDVANAARRRIGALGNQKFSLRLETVIRGDRGGEIRGVFDRNHNGTPIFTVLQVLGAEFSCIKRGQIPLTTVPRVLMPVLDRVKDDEDLKPFLDRLA